MQTEQKWVSVWGNAVSVAENRPERYAKNITIRYPVHIPFSGQALRLTFDNYCGTEPENPNFFLPEYDSGDHPHPSPAGYRRMAEEVPTEILK